VEARRGAPDAEPRREDDRASAKVVVGHTLLVRESSAVAL
jgi:hypothetical protein